MFSLQGRSKVSICGCWNHGYFLECSHNPISVAVVLLVFYGVRNKVGLLPFLPGVFWFIVREYKLIDAIAEVDKTAVPVECWI